jgi:hypothetical protein
MTRSALGQADVSDTELAGMVATSLQVDRVELLTSIAEVAPYDLEALTTAGRYWVHGTARHAGGDSPYRFYVKVVQSWERSPIFAFVPEDIREAALAGLPWRREPQVYRSDLALRLPAGLSMPACYGVFDVDDLSAAIWLETIDAMQASWDTDRFRAAAYLLGRLAASSTVAPVASIAGVGNVPRQYAFGRLAHQVLPPLRGADIWNHPLVSATFDDDLRKDLTAAAEALPEYLDELDDVPDGTLHGDACTRNLLVTSNNGFVVIDFGFWGRGPLGFDLTQLLMGEVQMGERPAAELAVLEQACLPAYRQGLLDEGVEMSESRLRRAHALLMLEFAGLSAVPLEFLDGPPTPERQRIAAERAESARFILDLVADTA